MSVVGADLVKMSKNDFVQICGPADGIRLFNAIKGRWVFLKDQYLILDYIICKPCGVVG